MNEEISQYRGLLNTCYELLCILFVNSELLPVFAPACVSTTIVSLNEPRIIIIIIILKIHQT